MYILGDIGNTETKIFLVSKNNKIIKKLTLSTRDINYTKLNRLFINFVVDYKKVKKILFCSVVPKSFNIIKKFLSKKARLKCYEVKDLNLKSLIKIKANYKQVGSDRLTNAISLVNNTNNFIIFRNQKNFSFSIANISKYIHYLFNFNLIYTFLRNFFQKLILVCSLFLFY